MQTKFGRETWPGPELDNYLGIRVDFVCKISFQTIAPCMMVMTPASGGVVSGRRENLAKSLYFHSPRPRPGGDPGPCRGWECETRARVYTRCYASSEPGEMSYGRIQHSQLSLTVCSRVHGTWGVERCVVWTDTRRWKLEWRQPGSEQSLESK